MTWQNNFHYVQGMKDQILIGITIVLLGFFIISIFTGTSHNASANEFLKMPIRVHASPTICALEPSDANFSKIGNQLLDKTEYAVLDWKTKLNAASGRHPIWNITLIKVPIGQQNSFNYTKCDITIHYLPKPQTKDEEFVALGVTIPNFETGKTNIEIYYLDFQPNYRMVEWYEGNQEYYTYVDEPYYTGRVATDTQLSSVIRHEIGHSLGLGHYVVSNEELEKIVDGREDMPSIMIDTATVLGVTHYDITPLDINKIKSIYGDGGFDNQHLSSVGYQRTHILSTSKTSYSTDDRIELSIDTSKFTNDASGILLIVDSSGKLTDEISISKSNSTVYLSDKYNNEKGKYWIEFINPFTGDYDFTSFTSDTEVTASNVIQQTASAQIPPWVKNTAKWWSDNQLDDSEFIKGMQYLIDKGLMVVPKGQSSESSSNQIPKWIKTNAGWWAQGQISDDEFVKGIQYLISSGSIKL